MHDLHELVGSPVSGLIRGYGGLSDWLDLVWGGLGYWVDRLCGWVLLHGYHVIV